MKKYRSLKEFLIDFKHNQRASIITLWGMIFIAMGVYFICWLTIGLPLVYFVNAVRVQMAGQLDATGSAVINTVFFSFEIHPVIAMLGWFVYGILSSAKRQSDQYPSYD